MIHTSLQQAAQWMGTAWQGAAIEVHGATTDSRQVQPGQLFFALRGARTDGHDHLPQAAERGACAAVVEERRSGTNLPQLQVPNTELALADLARGWGRQLGTRFIGITGSNGKTSVKNILAHVLGQVAETQATPGNLNNEIGLPLTVLGISPSTRYAVLEMGCGKPGDIAYLARIVALDAALVNNVGPAHLERLGSIDGVAQEKSEIYLGLKPDGIGIVNADDAYRDFMLRRLSPHGALCFGIDQPAPVQARDIQIGETTRFTLVVPGGSATVHLHLPGLHQVRNALAASCIATALQVDLPTIRAGLESVRGTPGRLSAHSAPQGWTLFDDTYNANPGSVRAAIDFLVATPGPAWLVLGDMKELGTHEAELHREIGAYARARGIAQLFTTGPLAWHAAQAFGPDAQHFDTRDALAQRLATLLRPGVRALVKGSRSAGMEQVVGQVLATQEMTQAEAHAHVT